MFVTIVAFIIEYVKNLNDDVMDEKIYFISDQIYADMVNILAKKLFVQKMILEFQM